MNFYDIENELTRNCLRQFDKNEFEWNDLDCLLSLYDSVNDKLDNLEKLKKIYENNEQLENEYNKMDALSEELFNKINKLHAEHDAHEEAGYSITLDKEPPIKLENLKKEDIFYTPPRLEYLAAIVAAKNNDSYTKSLKKNTNLFKHLQKFSYDNTNNSTRNGGKNGRKKCSKNKKTKKQRNKLKRFKSK